MSNQHYKETADDSSGDGDLRDFTGRLRAKYVSNIPYGHHNNSIAYQGERP